MVDSDKVIPINRNSKAIQGANLEANNGCLAD